MTTMNWTRVRQENQARRYGRDYADDLPAFGSWADQRRVESGSASEMPIGLRRTRGPIPKVNFGTAGRRHKSSKPPRELARCPVCGQMVGRMRRHLAKAHGHLDAMAKATPATNQGI